MKNLYGGKIVEKDIIENLYSLELVDWFKNEITKLLIRASAIISCTMCCLRKWVSVESLISVDFLHSGINCICIEYIDGNIQFRRVYKIY